MWMVKKATSKVKKISKGVTETVSSVSQNVSSKVSSVSQNVSEKVSSVSQTAFKKETQSSKMIKKIISNTDSVMPMKDMSELATMSFQIEHFDNIIEFIVDKLDDIKMEKKSLKKRLNLLILVNYLLKYGASGFIDQFRAIQDIFSRYENLSKQNEEQKFTSIFRELGQRASNIKMLLNDKNALIREKQVARLVRQKLILQKGDYSQHVKKSSQNAEAQEGGKEENQNELKQEKVESFLEMYVWKYTSKLDKKLDDITDKIIEKIDEYLDGEIPESFEIDQLDGSNEKEEMNQEDKTVKREESIFMKKKLKIEDQNLLDLKQEPIVAQPKLEGIYYASQPVQEQVPIIKIEFEEKKEPEKQQDSLKKEEESQN